MTQLPLSLFDRGELAVARIPPHLRRVVADSSDKVAWLRARRFGVTATDAARLATPNSVASAAYEKVHGSFGGNRYTDYGREREPLIATWMQEHFGIPGSTLLFHAEDHEKHLATPDGVTTREDGRVELAEIKTTNKPFSRIPRHYLRQIWWQQYVLGADRTLFVWEAHKNFVPSGPPKHEWVERDENEIAKLVDLADRMLKLIGTKAARHD